MSDDDVLTGMNGSVQFERWRNDDGNAQGTVMIMGII